jgi:hypothetical protein
MASSSLGCRMPDTWPAAPASPGETTRPTTSPDDPSANWLSPDGWQRMSGKAGQRRSKLYSPFRFALLASPGTKGKGGAGAQVSRRPRPDRSTSREITRPADRGVRRRPTKTGDGVAPRPGRLE